MAESNLTTFVFCERSSVYEPIIDDKSVGNNFYGYLYVNGGRLFKPFGNTHNKIIQVERLEKELGDIRHKRGQLVVDSSDGGKYYLVQIKVPNGEIPSRESQNQALQIQNNCRILFGGGNSCRNCLIKKTANGGVVSYEDHKKVKTLLPSKQALLIVAPTAFPAALVIARWIFEEKEKIPETTISPEAWYISMAFFVGGLLVSVLYEMIKNNRLR